MSDSPRSEPPPESAEDLYENAPCGYVSTLYGGLIVRANRTFLAWTGYQADELVGVRRFHELLPPAGRIYYETHYAPLLQMQGKVSEIALEVVCADRRRLPVLINATLVPHVDRQQSIIRVTVFDATARRRYEQELLRERQRAEQATEAKERFIAMVSHEIRSPLSAIVAVRQLFEKTELTDQQRRLVSMLKSSSENLLGLVTNILDLGRLEGGHETLQMSSFDVRALLDAVLEAQRARAQQRALVMELSVTGELPDRVVGDADKISQVLTNLLSNALKFTERGAVRLCVHGEPAESGGVNLAFSVSDTGVGIPADRLAAIFEEYAQAAPEVRARYGGTGLGLAISKRLVELHGGELKVVSQPGSGSTFSFVLRMQRDGPSDSGG